MKILVTTWGSAVAALSVAVSSAAGAPAPIDPAALAVVKRYVGSMMKPDPSSAYRLLTPAQQRYFRNARNFASNYDTTEYRILSYSIASATMRNANLAEVDVSQTTSVYDVAAAHTATIAGTEPYFALRTKGSWGVKEIFEPWKSYAPKASGRAGGLVVVVDRVEFFERRIQVDCTLRNMGSKPLQVLPLLQGKLEIDGASVPAMNTADFPLNDRQFYEGARIYPFHQVVGYINFPRSSQADADLTATLVIGPVVEDGAQGPVSVSVGPLKMPKL